MPRRRISSKHNPIYMEARKLLSKRGRDKAGLILVEGDNTICELLSNEGDEAPRLKHIIIREDEELAISQRFGFKETLDVFLLDRELFLALSTLVTPTGVMAVVHKPKASSLDELISAKRDGVKAKEGLAVVVLDRLQDPGNAGAVIRTAVCAGFDAIVLIRGTVDVYSEKVIRASAGMSLGIPFVYMNDHTELIGALRALGIRIICCDMQGETRYDMAEYSDNIAIVLGNESEGIGVSLLSAADTRVYIPMASGAESLNASIAGAIVIYERVRAYATKN